VRIIPVKDPHTRIKAQGKRDNDNPGEPSGNELHVSPFTRCCCPPCLVSPSYDTGASDETHNDEVQTDLFAAVADRSSYRDRQRHSRNAWTSRFRARHARPPA
jgi:hypothetical protein